MSSLKGCFLVPTSKNPNKGLWFIFHHETDGVLAVDLTSEHPDVPYRHFNSVLNIEDKKPDSDKIVLRGGPMQDDSAMLVIHNTPAADPASHIISPDFAFLSYRYTLIPGQPPAVTTADHAPTRIHLGDGADFVIVVGFRLWEMEVLEAELADWQWMFLPASPDIVYRTPAQDRLQRALLQIN